ETARGHAGDALAVPLQSEEEEQSTDQGAERSDWNRGERDAENRHHRRQHDQARGCSNQSGSPAARRTDPKHDDDHLDRLDRRRQEGGQEDDACAGHLAAFSRARKSSDVRVRLSSALTNSSLTPRGAWPGCSAWCTRLAKMPDSPDYPIFRRAKRPDGPD